MTFYYRHIHPVLGLAVGLMLLLLAGCGAQLRTMPVGRGQTRVSASVGGPLLAVSGQTVPIPYAMAGITYGVADRINLHTDAHLLAAVFKTAALTPGITVFPKPILGTWQPSIGADLLMFSDFQQTRVYPEITLALARPFSSWTPYAGVKNTFQTSRRPAQIPSLFAGTSYRMKRAQIFVELDWLAVNRGNRDAVADYQGIGQHGALAPHVGFSLDLDRRRP